MMETNWLLSEVGMKAWFYAIGGATYDYVSCLEEEDQGVFVDEYIRRIYLYSPTLIERYMILSSGGILMGVWQLVMQAIAPCLKNVYVMHRYIEQQEWLLDRESWSPYRYTTVMSVSGVGWCTKHVLCVNNAMYRVLEKDLVFRPVRTMENEWTWKLTWIARNPSVNLFS